MHASKHGKVILHPVVSTNVHSLGYDPDRRQLHVKFHSGHEGHYSNVDYNTYVGVRSAPSKGKALHRLVAKFPGKHPWTRYEKPSSQAGK
jgi:KTSC domain